MKHRLFSLLSVLVIIAMNLPSGSTTVSAQLEAESVDTQSIENDNFITLPIIMRSYSNNPPYQPSNPSPADGATDQSIAANLTRYGVTAVVMGITVDEGEDTVLVQVSANLERLFPSVVPEVVVTERGSAEIRVFNR